MGILLSRLSRIMINFTNAIHNDRHSLAFLRNKMGLDKKGCARWHPNIAFVVHRRQKSCLLGWRSKLIDRRMQYPRGENVSSQQSAQHFGEKSFQFKSYFYSFRKRKKQVKRVSKKCLISHSDYKDSYSIFVIRSNMLTPICLIANF